MAPSRTPPQQAQALEVITAKFNADYLAWRKLLQQVIAARIKVLRSLEKDGSMMAAELLGEKPRYENATRCNQCAGCKIMAKEQACQSCPGCRGRDGCVEYTRLCFTWDRAARNFFSASVASGVSSNLEIATVNLDKY